jgi:16S rRNA processing protein RimM
MRFSDPMAYNANILLGRISKVHGYEGAVTVKLEKNLIENVPDIESVFLEIEGKPVPFFILESDYPGGDILRLKFDGYNTMEQANEFTGCKVFLISGEKEENNADVRTFHNYRILLPGNSHVGTISEIIENPGQWLLKIITLDAKELLIPFHEDFIVSIDKRKKIIIMDLPEGLLEIN